jgi:outer membrane receptor protein involved in Fe transport
MILAATLAAIVAVAPSPSPSPTPSLPPTIGTVTVVSGSPQSLHRAPQAASVLDTRALRASPAASLDQVLRALPGFDRDRSNAAFTNYGQLRLSFAGAGADRGALFVDGVPGQDGFGGQVDWNALPPSEVERAELLRGPGSALYGSGAIGGALSLTTLRPDARDATFSMSAGGIDRGSAALATDRRIGATDALVFASTRRLAYNVIPPDQTSRVDRTARSTADVLHLKLRAGDGSNGLLVDALVSDDAQEDGRPSDGFSRALRQLALSWTQTRRESFGVTAFARTTTLVNLADRFPSAPGEQLYTQHVPTSDAGVRARWTIPLDRAGESSALTMLLEHRMVSGRSDQLTPAGVVQSDVAGTQRLDGAALQAALQGRLGAILGARYDTISTHALGDRTAAALSPRFALHYDLSPAVALRTAFGTGLRAPYLNELVRSFRIGTVLQQSNPNLVPERSASAQLGIDIASGASRFALDYTGTRVRDAIGFRTISPTVQQRSNFGRTASDALTGEYDHTAACTRVRAFGVAQHARVVVGAPVQVGKRLAYVPDSAASLGVERTVRALTGGIELSYSGPTFADDLERQPLGSALLVGGRLTLRGADGAALSLAVDNLADKLYLTSIDRLGPPASVSLRVSVPVGTRSRTTPNAACG